MATLNLYRKYSGLDTKDRIVLIKAVTINFKSPLEKNTPPPGKLEGERCLSNTKDLARLFGYDYFVKNVPTMRVKTDTKVEGVTMTTITYDKHITLFGAFSPYNLE